MLNIFYNYCSYSNYKVYIYNNNNKQTNMYCTSTNGSGKVYCSDPKPIDLPREAAFFWLFQHNYAASIFFA